MIPRVVHHMWLQGWEDAPRKPQELAALSWGSMEHRFWDEAQLRDLVRQQYPEWLGFYQRLPTLIIKCDVSRAFVLHAFGGVYADVDLQPSAEHGKVLDELAQELQGRIAVVSQAQVGPWRVPNNNWMACAPAHPYWLSEYLPHVQNFLKQGGSWSDVLFSAIMPTYKVFAASGPVALMQRSRGLLMLSTKTSARLCVHPKNQSSWISYRSVNRHLIVMALLFVLACLGAAAAWGKVRGWMTH